MSGGLTFAHLSVDDGRFQLNCLSKEIATMRIWGLDTYDQTDCTDWVDAATTLFKDWNDVFNDRFWDDFFESQEPKQMEMLWEELGRTDWNESLKEKCELLSNSFELIHILEENMNYYKVEHDELDIQVPVRKIERAWLRYKAAKPDTGDEEQYQEECAECMCRLSIDTPIMVWQSGKGRKGDEEDEMTLCSDCYYSCRYNETDTNEDNE